MVFSVSYLILVQAIAWQSTYWDNSSGAREAGSVVWIVSFRYCNLSFHMWAYVSYNLITWPLGISPTIILKDQFHIISVLARLWINCKIPICPCTLIYISSFSCVNMWPSDTFLLGWQQCPWQSVKWVYPIKFQESREFDILVSPDSLKCRDFVGFFLYVCSLNINHVTTLFKQKSFQKQFPGWNT